MKRPILLILAALTLGPARGVAQARSPEGAPASEALRVLGAARTPEAPTLDGRLDDAVWSLAPLASGFTQARPDPGAPASERTDVRVLYDGHALYVGVRLYDSRPDSIIAPLARRDENVYSDRFELALDTYLDRRTAYVFSVNARGVKRDVRLSNDSQADASWDAVWDVATRVEADGWKAEFRVPLSQLRFRAASRGSGSGAADPNGVEAGAKPLVWGVNFTRTLARRDEVSHWSPTPPDAAGRVSRFGELHGLAGLAPPRRLELQPYSVARLTRAPGNPEDPFHQANEVVGSAGLDLKYGVTSDLTLTATINPDFGQVEADPAVVNLSAFESYFDEKRPFFSEGAEIFDTGRPQLFYSRRIGRTPRGPLPAGASFSERPEASTILGAAKLSGRLPGGWSVGVLNAVTAVEDARYVDAAGETHSARVEPLTGYTVGRVTRDFRRGRTVLGGSFTATHRRLGTGSLASLLPAAAYTGGIDGRHRFGGGNYQLTGSLFGSRVEGSDSALARIQRAPGHYFHRPDAHHLAYDPDREVLGASGGRAAVQKIGGGRWRWGFDVDALAPGFEINDLGFGSGADRIRQGSRVSHQRDRAGSVLRSWRLSAGQMSRWTFGGEREDAALTLSGEAELLRQWGGSVWYMRHIGGITTNDLRGGPALFYPGRHMGSFGLYSDRRRPVRISVGNFWEIEDGTGSRALHLHGTATAQAGTRLSFSLRPSVRWNVSTWQYVGQRLFGEQPQYLLGRLDQTTGALTARMDYILSPTLSLQLYAQPFVSAGAYSDFRTVSDPRAARFDERFHTFTSEQITAEGRAEASTLYRVDLNGDREADIAFGDPSFNVRHLRSNAVLRWEWRPGSTLFVVWNQNRSGFDPEGRFHFSREAHRLFEEPGAHVLLVKLSYWLGD